MFCRDQSAPKTSHDLHAQSADPRGNDVSIVHNFFLYRHGDVLLLLLLRAPPHRGPHASGRPGHLPAAGRRGGGPHGGGRGSAGRIPSLRHGGGVPQRGGAGPRSAGPAAPLRPGQGGRVYHQVGGTLLLLLLLLLLCLLLLLVLWLILYYYFFLLCMLL